MMKELPNKREVECCASCKFYSLGYDCDNYCSEYGDVDIEAYWLCDDYEKGE